MNRGKITEKLIKFAMLLIGLLPGEDYKKAIELQSGLIGHMHLKDLVFHESNTAFVASDVSHPQESEHNVYTRIRGEGIVPWSTILKRIKANGYEDWLSLEYERRLGIAGCGCMTNLGVHFIDIALYLTDSKSTKVLSSVYQYNKDYDIEIYASSLLKMGKRYYLHLKPVMLILWIRKTSARIKR